MSLTLVNRSDAYPPARLVAPAPYGYLHLAAAVAPPAGRTPFPARSPARTALLERLKPAARELEARPDVVKATVYRTAVAPPVPVAAGRGPLPHDVVVLVETTTPETVADVRASDPYRRLTGTIRAAAADLRVTEATCAKRIGDVDKTRPGVFLFNYFLADDVPTALDLWDYLAGWYVRRTGLDNSTVLRPTGDAGFAFVNHARWDGGLARFAAHQFTAPGFRTYLLANLKANGVTAMPMLYRLA